MKKFSALFLVFSILLLSGNVFAKEKKGADLIIQKTDGQQVRGELIAVKQTSLLLLERESGKDVSVNIVDIGVIKIVKKSKAMLGAGIGFLIGSTVGVVVGLTTEEDLDITSAGWGFIAGIVVGVPAILIGAIVGAVAGTDKTIQFEGKTDSDIREILEKLRKKSKGS